MFKVFLIFGLLSNICFAMNFTADSSEDNVHTQPIAAVIVSVPTLDLTVSDVKAFASWKFPSNLSIVTQSFTDYIQPFLNDTTLGKADKSFAQAVGACFCGFHYIVQLMGPGNIPGTDLAKPFPVAPEHLINIHTTLKQLEKQLAQLIQEDSLTIEDLWINDMPMVEPTFSDGELSIKNYLTPVKFYRNLPSTSTSACLLIGGERSEENPLTDTYTLNIDIMQTPDMLGDGSNIYHLISLPDSKFSLVEFNFIDHGILSDRDLLLEYKRILKQGGKIHFKTQHQTDKYYRDQQHLEQSFQIFKEIFPTAQRQYFSDSKFSAPANYFWLFIT